MRLTLTILAMGLLTTLFACGQKKVLTEQEAQTCTAISYDQTLAELIKKETNKEIILIPEINEYGEVLETTGEGLCSISDESEGYKFVTEHKEAFRQKGYLLFVFEDDKSQKFITTIKGKGELDILKWRQTNGINYNLENKKIISKLESWKAKNDFIILGAGMDWLQLQYTNSAPNFDTFANEVYEFCPDIVDQGAGDIPTLIKELKRINGVYLWWD